MVLFFLFRIVLWNYVSYHFILDAVEVLRSNAAHDRKVIYVFIFANIGLTVLQFAWMGEIITTSSKLLFMKDPTLSIARGDSKTIKHE